MSKSIEKVFGVYGEHYSIYNYDNEQEISCDQFHICYEEIEDEFCVKDSHVCGDYYFVFDTQEDLDLYKEWKKNDNELEIGFTNGLWSLDHCKSEKDAQKVLLDHIAKQDFAIMEI